MVGAKVTVFNKHAATVKKVSGNGKRVYVAGTHYTGWTKAANVKEAA